jgi:hypothetical protein
MHVMVCIHIGYKEQLFMRWVHQQRDSQANSPRFISMTQMNKLLAMLEFLTMSYSRNDSKRFKQHWRTQIGFAICTRASEYEKQSKAPLKPSQLS